MYLNTRNRFFFFYQSFTAVSLSLQNRLLLVAEPEIGTNLSKCQWHINYLEKAQADSFLYTQQMPVF